MSCASFSMDVVAEDSLEGAPLSKRRRVSSSSRSCEATRTPPCSILKKLWFADGDIILEIEQRLLKVHRNRLQCSVIFSDMLHIPQPSQTEQIDGCPTVSLVGDTLADWEAALKWIYHNSDFLSQAITFDILAGALRISTKYEIADLRHWAVAELTSRWPVDVLNMRLNALPHAAEAIALAQECTVPEILPAAFYALSVQKFHSSADGGRSHIVLSPTDLRRLIAGHEALQDVLVRILIDPLADGCYPDTNTLGSGCFNTATSGSSAACAQCAPRLATYWRTRLAPDAKSPWGTWLVRELAAMLHDATFVNTLCPECVRAHLSTVKWRLGRLRGGMAGFFLLG